MRTNSGKFSTQIKGPFDPSSLKVEVKNTTIVELCEMLKNNMIDLNPHVRKGQKQFLGKRGVKEKSRLIESIILGIPLPSFYFYIDSTQRKWVVIDGLKRLCCLKEFFIDKDLRLSDLQFLTATYEGKMYYNFTYFEQLEMCMRPVTLNVISGNISTETKYAIFNTINSKWNV